MDVVQRVLAALAAPTRCRIVELLRDGPQPVNNIAARLALSQPQTSKHLRVLRSAGLVAVAPRAQQRLYALRPEPFREFHDWFEQFRRIWEARFDALDDLLERMQRKENKG
jgi:DNA-binding transcriptional ArsR family regulator